MDSLHDELTVLCENSVAGPFGLIGEHGWAIHAAVHGRSILFDTGQGKGIIGNSLHLGFAGPEQFTATLQALEKFGVKRLGAGHCTGLENAARLFSHFGDSYFFSAVGTRCRC